MGERKGSKRDGPPAIMVSSESASNGNIQTDEIDDEEADITVAVDDAADQSKAEEDRDGCVDHAKTKAAAFKLEKESASDHQTIEYAQMKKNHAKCARNDGHATAAAIPSGDTRSQYGRGKDLTPLPLPAASVLEGQEAVDFSTHPFPTSLQRHQGSVSASSQPGAYAVCNHVPYPPRREPQEQPRQDCAPPVQMPPEDTATNTYSSSELSSSSDYSNPLAEELQGLAIANPCSSFATIVLNLPLAQQMDRHQATRQAVANRARWQCTRQKARPGVLALLCLILGVIIFGVLLAVTCLQGENNPDMDDSPSEPLFAVTKAPIDTQQQTLLEGHVLELMPDYTLKAMKDPSSPQSLAYRFILEDPSLSTYADWRIRQRFALATFFHATRGEEWFHSDKWLSYNSDECTWYSQPTFGIKLGNLDNETYYSNPCDRGLTSPNPLGVYKHLWLFNNGLNGTLPPELFWLTSLRTISIYKNSLQGSIPSTIGLLSGFEGVNIGMTHLTGGIPTQVGLLTSIKYFVTQGTPLAGTVPSEIGLLSNLRYLILTASQLTGTTPKELGKCESLEWLILDQNRLTGPLPSQLGDVRGMEQLRIFGQNLSSNIPTELGNLPRLRSFMAFDNSFTGELPSEMGRMSSMNRLQLHGNRLHGRIPSELGNVSTLKYMSLQNNLLTDLPSEIGSLTDLRFLYLQENRLTELPSEIGRLTNLDWMLLHSNNLLTENRNVTLDTVPLEIVALARSQSFWWFNVSDHAVLSGTVPETICAESAKDLNGFLFDCSTVLCGCACACRAPGHL